MLVLVDEVSAFPKTPKREQKKAQACQNRTCQACRVEDVSNHVLCWSWRTPQHPTLHPPFLPHSLGQPYQWSVEGGREEAEESQDPWASSLFFGLYYATRASIKPLQFPALLIPSLSPSRSPVAVSLFPPLLNYSKRDKTILTGEKRGGSWERQHLPSSLQNKT